MNQPLVTPLKYHMNLFNLQFFLEVFSISHLCVFIHVFFLPQVRFSPFHLSPFLANLQDPGSKATHSLAAFQILVLRINIYFSLYANSSHLCSTLKHVL